MGELIMKGLGNAGLNYQRFVAGGSPEQIRDAMKSCPKGLIAIPFQPNDGGKKRTIGVAYYEVRGRTRTLCSRVFSTSQQLAHLVDLLSK